MIVPDQVNSIVHVPQAVRINFTLNSFFESNGAVMDLHRKPVKCRARQRLHHTLGPAVILESERTHRDRVVEPPKKLETLRR